MLTALFLCIVASVHDGDTFRCQDGTAVRLTAIDAPELHGCRRGRVCVPGDGQASKHALERMIGNHVLTCRRTGVSYSRITAWCRAGNVDLSCAMVRSGMARYWPEYDRNREICR